MLVHSQDPSDPVHAPHTCRGAVAFSPDTTTFEPETWRISPRPAYGNAIQLRNGSTLIAKRRQRPQFSFADGVIEVGPRGEWPKRVATHLSSVVDLEFGQNADGWGAGWASLLPLQQNSESK